MCSGISNFSNTMGKEWIVLSIATLIFASSAHAARAVQHHTDDNLDLHLPPAPSQDLQGTDYHRTSIEKDSVFDQNTWALIISIIGGLILVLAYVSYLLIKTRKDLWKMSSDYECLHEDYDDLKQDYDDLVEVEQRNRFAFQHEVEQFHLERDALHSQLTELFLQSNVVRGLAEKVSQLDGTEIIGMTQSNVIPNDENNNNFCPEPVKCKWFISSGESESELSDTEDEISTTKPPSSDKSSQGLLEGICNMGYENVRSPMVIDGNNDRLPDDSEYLPVPETSHPKTISSAGHSNKKRLCRKKVELGGGDRRDYEPLLSDSSSECSSVPPPQTKKGLGKSFRSLFSKVVPCIPRRKRSGAASGSGDGAVVGRESFKPP